MKKAIIAKTLVGIIVVGGGIGYLVYQAMQSSWSYYYSVDEFIGNETAAQKYSFRIAGLVQKDSIKHDMEKMDFSFLLDGTNSSVPVVYNGLVPDNFEQGREVVVQGQLDTAGVFRAEKLMTKCESKYKAKVN